VLRRTSPVGERARRGQSKSESSVGWSEDGSGVEWVDSLASESVVAWAEGADAGWEFWMAAARAGSWISRPGWDRRRAVGNALAGGAAVVVGVSEWCWWRWRRRRRRSITQHAGREWGTVCSALRGVCLNVDLQAKTSDGPTGLEVSGKHSAATATTTITTTTQLVNINNTSPALTAKRRGDQHTALLERTRRRYQATASGPKHQVSRLDEPVIVVFHQLTA